MNNSRIGLLDRILSKEIPIAFFEQIENGDQVTSELHFRLSSSVKFDIKNVDDFYREKIMKDKGFSLSRDLFSIRPPFDSVWSEAHYALDYGVLSQVHHVTESMISTLPEPIVACFAEMVGVDSFYSQSMKLDSLTLCPEKLQTYRENSIGKNEKPLLISNKLFVRIKDNAFFVGEAFAVLDAFGRPLSTLILDDYGARVLQKIALRPQTFIFPALLAFQFAHCKNVSFADIKPNKKLAKSYEKRHRHPLITFKTIEIDPIKKALETEGEISKNGFKKALHICRGHFATYTPEKGMLGRPLSEPLTIWKAAHIRGSKDNGIVIKDYKSKAIA